MKNFFQPTKITWIIFIPLFMVTGFPILASHIKILSDILFPFIFPLLILLNLGMLYFLDQGTSHIEFLTGPYPFVILTCLAYLFASSISWIYQSMKSRKQSNGIVIN